MAELKYAEEFGRDEHNDLRDDIKTYSDKVEDDYDEKISKLGKVDDEEADVADMEAKYNDLKKEVTEIRKQGKDVFMAHNLLLSFPSKLRIAKATQEPEDLKKAESILKEAQRELQDAKRQELVDVRAEVEDRFKRLMGEKPSKETEEALEEYSKPTITEDKAEDAEEAEEGDEKEEEPEETNEGINIDVVPDNPEEYFHFLGGKELKSIRDLLEYLPEMSDAEYEYYYYSRDINDYAEWIKEVFGYEELAEKIDKVDDKEKVAEIIKKEAGE